MKIVRCTQGSQTWFQARAGVCTGSHAADITNWLKQTKAEVEAGIRREGADRRHYRGKVVAELLTGMPDMDGYKSAYMERGIEMEADARTLYELQEGVMVEEIGFALHDTIPRMGGSVDGLVGDDGLIEIKCPATSTYLRWVLGGEVPEEHKPQMDFYLSVTGRKWVDFCSYDSRLPKPLQFFCIRYERDEQRIADLEAEVMMFNAEVDSVIDQLRKIVGPFELPAQMQEQQTAPPDDYGELGITDADITRIEREYQNEAGE